MNRQKRHRRQEKLLISILCGIGVVCICLAIGILSFLLTDRDRGKSEDNQTKNDLESVIETESEQETEPEEPEPEEEVLEVHFIDIGQGDASLIKCGGCAMLIDTGSADPEARRSERDLIEYLRQNEVEKLDYMLLSHGHEDHMGRACDVLDQLEVENVICDFGNDEGYVQRLQGVLQEKEESGECSVIVPQEGEEFALGGATVRILTGRLEDFPEAATETERVNNQSIGVKIIYGNRSFLFYGDGEASYETYLLENDIDIKADVLKVAHHGAAVSTSQEILEKVHPEYTVISSATQEDFGFPQLEVLMRLAAIQNTTFYTNKQGCIIASCDGEYISWTTRR